ncbi:MAG TPA: hypothetical protein VFP93_04145, partial [Gammaproteobacteria bacterium]|nr:hypothetical protein [Gammaproteobacteria bacterium]
MTRMSNSLTYAVLSSSLFLSTLIYADITINNDVVTQQATSVSANITIAPTGSVTVGGGDISVIVDTTNTLTLEPNT